MKSEGLALSLVTSCSLIASVSLEHLCSLIPSYSFQIAKVIGKVPEKYQKYSKGIQRTEPFSIIENLGNLKYVLAIEGSGPK